MFKRLLLSAALLTALPLSADPISDAVTHKDRPVEQRARDEYRHPAQTLRFFGIEEDMTVVEISPGGGWYTNILAPLVKDKGQLYAAHHYIDEDSSDYYRNSRKGFEDKVANYAPYANVNVTDFHPTKSDNIAPEGSADVVLTFRNVHNWLMRHGDEGIMQSFNAFNKALKKGGVLGIVEHRMPEALDQNKNMNSGYVKQSYVIEMAKKAGFRLAASSEVNANELDTAQHPRGVWTLPPRLRLGEEDKAKYMAIGESDRMTLKFIKE